MSGRLAWSEAEDLPFEDATFDASWSVGGFNYYSDHERALREMRRVTKPGGPVVIADESPSLHRAGLGHLIGIPSLDAWWLRRLGLDRDFVKMVLNFDVDLPALFERVWPAPSATESGIGLGYCMVETKRFLRKTSSSVPWRRHHVNRQPRKNDRPSIRNSTSRMQISTGIARAAGNAPSAVLPCGLTTVLPHSAARPVRLVCRSRTTS